MFSFRKSLATTAGLILVIGLIAIFTPSGTRGQSGGLKLPFYGEASHDEAAFHVHNNAEKSTAIGVYGTGRQGVTGQTSEDVRGVGVYGLGGRGEFSSGVHGKADNGYGVFGLSANNIGVLGIRGESFDNFQTRGILGTKDNAIEGVSRVAGGKGVAGVANSGANAVGVYGESTGGIAGFFRGRVTATEHILTKEVFAEKITGASKLFRIDHPQHPAEKYLSHVSVESDEMANVYSGNVTLDARGGAWVRLPDWFEALNTDFRYQLTCVGGFAPVYVAREITGHRFRIAGGRAGLKVSWQVTGVRHDAYAKAHPLRVEQDKPAAERGRYLHPVDFGLPASRGINYEGRRRIERVVAGHDAERGER
jgi:hypothetical protein